MAQTKTHGFSPYDFPRSLFNSQAERSSFGKKQVWKTGFSLSGKGLRVRKVGEGKGKTIHLLLFGLLSDRFLGLLYGFKLTIAVSSLFIL